jgi:hypothetical protein
MEAGREGGWMKGERVEGGAQGGWERGASLGPHKQNVGKVAAMSVRRHGTGGDGVREGQAI